MTRLYSTVAALALTTSSIGPALGQSDPLVTFNVMGKFERFEVDENATCDPAKIDLELDGYKGWTYVLSQEALELERTPYADSRSVMVPAPAALSSVGVYGTNDASNPEDEKWLIAWQPDRSSKPDDWRCAWARPAGLLHPDGVLTTETFEKGPMPLAIQDIRDDAENVLFAQAIVHNLQRDANKSAEAYKEIGKPATNTLAIQAVPYSIYAKYRVTGAEAGPMQPGIYYLLGDRRGRNTSSLYGWVNTEEILVRSSLVTVDVDDKNVEIYPVLNPEDPYDLGTLAQRTPIKGELRTGDLPGKATSKIMVLDTYPDSTVIRERLLGGFDVEVAEYRAVLPTVPCANNDLDECVTSIGSSASVGDMLDAANVDVVFLLDRTSSMKDYFTYAANAIEAFATKVQTKTARSKGTVRIAIYTYGDYGADKRTVQLHNIRDFTTPEKFNNLVAELKRIANDFDKQNYDKNGSRIDLDKQEAPLDALKFVAETASWDGASGSRMIIHIFDHGSRPLNEASKRDPDGPVGQVSLGSVAQAINDAGASYYGILVEGDSTSSEDSTISRNAAVIQADALTKAISALSESVLNSDNVIWNTTGQAKNKVQESISASLQRAWEDSISLADFSRRYTNCLNTRPKVECDRIRDGVFRNDESNRDKFLVETSTANRKILAAAEIEAIVEHTQGSLSEFWLRPNSPQAITPHVRMSVGQLEITKPVIKKFCNYLLESESKGATRQRIARFMDDLADLMADEGLDFNPADTLAKSLSLPFIERAKYLRLPASQLAALSGTKGHDANMIEAFCTTNRLLGEIDTSQNQSYRYAGGTKSFRIYEDTSGDWRLEQIGPDAEPYDWFVTDIFGNTYAEIPFSYFP